jgi:hypothetical protein
MLTTAANRILLVPDGRPRIETSADAKVRRYRLARVRVSRTHAPGDPRLAHLAKAYD